MTVRVLLADDHGAIRSGLRLMLESAADIEVVGEAADGAAAVANTRALQPDVVLMDLRMPGTDGVAATAQISAEHLAEVVVLTTYDLDDYVDGALRAGAAGFLLKTVAAPDLLNAVRRVAAGEAVLAPEVTRRLLTAFATVHPQQTDEDPPLWLAHLTTREREVLRCLARGMSNAEICTELTISAATTKTHVSRLLAKMDCTSRTQAAILAREAGLASAP
ncbi:MAG TPA: response regulator transcription factor [Beutenbergiaceae bacterium]|nr:response regulator transcription factor [Beutenbergiaceae bacterium]